MHHREFPITPSQQAIPGALFTSVEGGKKDDLRQMLSGLSALRHATEQQIVIAAPSVEIGPNMRRTGIQEILARWNPGR